MNPQFSRREFVRTAVIASTGIALGLSANAADNVALNRPVIGFSKPFQSLNAEETASYTSEIGWDGIECPVRAKGQIEPERVADELAHFVDVFRQRQLVIPSLATDIVSIDQPHAEKVLRTASRLGIKRLRLGFFKYNPHRPIAAQVDEFGRRLKDIGAACAELDLQAGVENHSGPEYFGAPIWDLYTALRDHQVKNVGYFFDIAHATIEGGLSWPVQVELTQSNYTGIYIKDFAWTKEANHWSPTWCSLGEGMVNRSFINTLINSDYRGPICQHHEYPLGNKTEMTAHLKRDLRVLRSWLA